MIQNIHRERDSVLPTTQVINVNVDEEKKTEELAEESSPASSQPQHLGSESDDELELPHPADVKRAFWISVILIAIIAILVPIPLGISTYVFSPAFFTGWIVMAMVRVLAAYTDLVLS